MRFPVWFMLGMSNAKQSLHLVSLSQSATVGQVPSGGVKVVAVVTVVVWPSAVPHVLINTTATTATTAERTVAIKLQVRRAPTICCCMIMNGGVRSFNLHLPHARVVIQRQAHGIAG